VLGEAQGEGTVKRSEEDDFRAFVGVRTQRWRRAAYLMCHDWHTADDLVATVVGKVYQHWGRPCAADNPDAYAQRVLTTVWLDEQRRPWRREHPVEVLPEIGWTQPDGAGDRERLVHLLAQLRPDHRLTAGSPDRRAGGRRRRGQRARAVRRGARPLSPAATMSATRRTPTA
jgi:DNA-directed RNA polymerase specialized sigma24 family protein